MRFLTHWILTHLLFAGTMFFAAGADALGAATGAGDEGVSGEAGDGTIDSGSGAEGDGQPGSEAGDGKPEVQNADSAQAQPTTHRAVLESFTKSTEFKALKPEVQKAVTRLQQSLRTVSEALSPLGGLKNAQEIARVLSDVGGIEALTDMQGRLAEIDEIDAKL